MFRRLFHLIMRKRALYFATSALAAAITLALAGHSTPRLTPADSNDPDGLVTYRSHDGKLNVTLTAEARMVRIGDLEVPGTTYNQSYAGPVLHVQPGDLMRVRLINHLAEPTNLHFHGIRTSPLGNGDNVHLAVGSGQSFTYEVRIPIEQPSGTYWYHAHPHGLSEAQVMGGLSGALIVDPPATNMTFAHIRDRLLVLKDKTFDDDTGNTIIDDEMHGVLLSINGRLTTELDMRPVERQRWRFTNQSANRPLDLALDGHRFMVVAKDGVDTVGEPDTDVLSIMPAARVDVLVEGGVPGRYALRAKGIMSGTGDQRLRDRVLGHLTIAGAPVAPGAFDPDRLPTDLRNVRIDSRRTVALTETTADDPDQQKFFINGKMFDLNRVDVRVPLGSTEEWTIRNDTDDLHVFHIHQLSFQVIEVDGQPAPFNGVMDTVPVRARSAVKLRMAFDAPEIVGRFMFHCHMLRHEDKGMMAQIEVYRPEPPTLMGWIWSTYFRICWWVNGVPWSLCGTPST